MTGTRGLQSKQDTVRNHSFIYVLLLAVLWSGCSSERPGVRVAQPVRADIHVEFLAAGTTESRVVDVSFDRSSTLVEILVEEDDAVKKGQPLATLEGTGIKESLANLERDLMVSLSRRDSYAAQIELKRVQQDAQRRRNRADSHKAQASYRETVADATTEALQIAEASVDEAQAQLRQSRRERERLQKLFDEDIASQAQVERAEMDEEISLARRTRAMKQLEQLKKGVAAETRARARAQLVAVEARVPRDHEMNLELTLMERQLETTNQEILNKEAVIARERAKLAVPLESPTDGQVLEILLEIGEVARHNTIMRLVDTNEVWIEADVAEQDSNFVQVGQSVTVHLPSLEGSYFQGTVESVGAALRTPQGVVGNARFLEIKVRLKEEVEGLRPGLEADVEGNRVLVKDVLTVPHQAVIRDRGDSFVVVVEGSTARRIPVELGASDAEKVEVKTGLQESQRVVLDQPSRFVADTEVEVRS
jgi:multidrug efflux pump subunit AcrA (membrane-fusion protein)